MDNRSIAQAWMLIAILGLNVANASAGSNPRQADTAKPAKLLYVVEGSQRYLLPLIVLKLRNLQRPNSDRLIFSSVDGPDRLTEANSVQATLFDNLREAFGKIAVEVKSAGKTTADSLSTFLRQYQEVLVIKDTTLQDLLEIQFTLYDVTKDGKSIQYWNSSSVFIDPRSDHYQSDLIRCIDLLFKRTKVLDVNLTANRDPIGGVYYMTGSDTLLLRPLVDDESQEADRIYFWTQDTAKKPLAPIEPSRKDQLLKKLQPGSYTLYFKVSNGINYSITDTVFVRVYKQPHLSILRPGNGSFMRPLSDRLVIQQYLFGARVIDNSSIYEATYDSARFYKPSPELLVQITDQRNTVYASKSFAFHHPNRTTTRSVGDTTQSNRDTTRFARSKHDTLIFTAAEIVGDVDYSETPIRPEKSNKYSISFIARNPAIESNEVKHEIRLYQHLPLSLLYDVMIFPSDKNGLYHSWINAGAGLDLRINRFLSAVAIVGTDLAQASFKHYYIDLIANFGPIATLARPFNKLEGGPALLINHDDGTQSTGFKISYTFYSGSQTNLKIGGSFYNLDHVNFFAIHFTGDIFFNH